MVSRKVSNDAWFRELDQAYFLELRRDDFLVERLHDVFVGAAVERALDMLDAIFGRTKHNLGLIAARHAAQMTHEVVAVHHRHVPVEQDRLRHRALANDQGVHTVFGFDDLKTESFQDAARHFTNNAGILNNETRFHIQYPTCERRMPKGLRCEGCFWHDFENTIDVEDDHELAVEAVNTAGELGHAGVEVDGIFLAAVIVEFQDLADLVDQQAVGLAA